MFDANFMRQKVRKQIYTHARARAQRAESERYMRVQRFTIAMAVSIYTNCIYRYICTETKF